MNLVYNYNDIPPPSPSTIFAPVIAELQQYRLLMCWALVHALNFGPAPVTTCVSQEFVDRDNYGEPHHTDVSTSTAVIIPDSIV
jgi:hypothetical protein